MEEFAIFSKEDCEYILSNLDYSQFISAQSKVQEMDSQTGDSVKIRFRKENNASYLMIRDGHLKSFVFEKISNHIDIKSLPDFKIMKYQKGDSLAKHNDFARYGVIPLYKTVSLQLSDETTYSGGDLLVKGIPQSRTQGNLIMFNPNFEHEVTELTDGVRYVIVLFLLEENFNYIKSII